jgi:hypothetical protein
MVVETRLTTADLPSLIIEWASLTDRPILQCKVVSIKSILAGGPGITVYDLDMRAYIMDHLKSNSAS